MSGMGLAGLLLRVSPIRMRQPQALTMVSTFTWVGQRSGLGRAALAPVFCQQEPQGPVYKVGRVSQQTQDTEGLKGRSHPPWVL